MWVTTQNGFYSAVAIPNDDKSFKVRGRDRKSLEVLADYLGRPHTDIIVGAGTDYPVRLICSREDWWQFLGYETDNVDYTNFKNAITATRGRVWHDVLMDVWVAMLKVTPTDLAAQNRLAWQDDDTHWTNYRANSGFRRNRKGKSKKGRNRDHEYESQIPELETLDDRDLNSMPLHALTDAEWQQLMEEAP